MAAKNEDDKKPLLEADADGKQEQNNEEKKNKPELTEREAYFSSLNEWVQHANMSQQHANMFPWYLMTHYPQIFPAMNPVNQMPLSTGQQQTQHQAAQQHQNLPNFGANLNNNIQMLRMAAGMNNGLGLLRLLDEQAQAELINNAGGYEYVIAPFWKRAVAETIDVLLLLLLKIMVIFTIINLFDLDLGFELDKDTLKKAMDDDDYTSFVAILMGFLAVSSDLLMLEILTKVIVCFNEAIWTTLYSGATPGKALMNIRVLYIEAIMPLPNVPIQFQLQLNREPMRALMFPGETPGFVRSFMRAVAKNIIMTLLFPMCFVMIFFKNNRTAYDIMTKTVVVECNPNPILRRQQR